MRSKVLNIGLCFALMGASMPLIRGAEAQQVIGYQKVLVGKQCGNCNRRVPRSSRVGQTCPYCGAYWGGYREKIAGHRTRYGYKSGARGNQRTRQPRTRSVTLHVNGTPLQVKACQNAGRLLVPVREVFERAGATVDLAASGQLVVALGATSVTLRAGKKEVTVNYGAHASNTTWPVAPRIYGGRTYVPLRALAEALGFSVESTAGTVSLTRSIQ